MDPDEWKNFRRTSSNVLEPEAHAFLNDLLQGDTFDCYMQNDGVSRDNNTKVQVAFATDSTEAANVALTNRLAGDSLVLIGTLFSSAGEFRVYEAERVRSHEAQAGALRIGVRLTFSLPTTRGSRLSRSAFTSQSRESSKPLPTELMKYLSQMPTVAEYRQSVDERLRHWRHYLTVWRRLADEKEWTVHFTGFRTGRSPTLLVFALNGRPPWERLKNSIRQPVIIAPPPPEETDPSGVPPNEPARLDLGTLEEVDVRKRRMTIRLHDQLISKLDMLHDIIPEKGLLAHQAFVERTEIRRLERGLDRLSRGDARNPNLATFLFDSSRARAPIEAPNPEDTSLTPPSIPTREVTLNELQRQAVTRALAAPDLYLIKGPPGTGKTHVIAQMCRTLVAHGQRVLIASQTNIAVDNALSRLIPDGHIRALRYGPEHRVEVEGKPFHETHVVERWLTETRETCRHRWGKLRKAVHNKQLLDVVLQRLDEHIRRLRSVPVLQNKARALVEKRAELEALLQEAQAELAEHEHRLTSFDDAIGWLAAVANMSISGRRDGEWQTTFVESMFPEPHRNYEDAVGPLFEKTNAYKNVMEQLQPLYDTLSDIIGRDEFEHAVSTHCRSMSTSSVFQLYALHKRLTLTAQVVCEAFEENRTRLNEIELSLKQYDGLIAEAETAEDSLRSVHSEITQLESQRERTMTVLTEYAARRQVIDAWLRYLPNRAASIARWAKAAQHQFEQPSGHEQAIEQVLDTFTVQELLGQLPEYDLEATVPVEAAVKDAIRRHFAPHATQAGRLSKLNDALQRVNQLINAVRSRVTELERAMDLASPTFPNLPGVRLSLQQPTINGMDGAKGKTCLIPCCNRVRIESLHRSRAGETG